MSGHYNINIQSAAPITIQVQNLENQPDPQHQHAAAQVQPRGNNGMKFSFREVALLTSIVPAYQIYDHFSKEASNMHPFLLIGGLAVTGIGAAALYFPSARRVLSAGAGLGCRLAGQIWRWGVAAPINGVRNYGGAVGGSLLNLASSAAGITRRALAGIGKTGTALAAGALRVSTNTIGEVGKAAGTLIESVGNVVPELTGLAITAGAISYLGIPHLTGTPDQMPMQG